MRGRYAKRAVRRAAQEQVRRAARDSAEQSALRERMALAQAAQDEALSKLAELVPALSEIAASRSGIQSARHALALRVRLRSDLRGSLAAVVRTCLEEMPRAAWGVDNKTGFLGREFLDAATQAGRLSGYPITSLAPRDGGRHNSDTARRVAERWGIAPHG